MKAGECYYQDGSGQWWYDPPRGNRTRAGVFVCVQCDDEFPRANHRAPPRYCTQQCAGKDVGKFSYPRGPKSPQWRGGRVKDHGYVRVYTPGHPKVGRKGYIMEHRLVMEEKIGRYLERHERVHHINGIKDDNRPENLELWAHTHPSGVRVHDKHCPTCTCGEVADESVETASPPPSPASV